MVKFRKRLLVAALSLTAATSGALGAAMVSSVSGSADEAAKEVNPIAKYEFKDTSNIGKDSMGEIRSYVPQRMEGRRHRRSAQRIYGNRRRRNHVQQ